MFNPRSAIYLDFEGEGEKSSGEIPEPRLSGVFRPHPTGKSGVYTPIYHNVSWQPLINGVRPTGHYDSLEGLISSLIAEAKITDSMIVYWSDHERRMVNELLPERIQEFEQHSFNLLPQARKLKRKFKKSLNEDEPKGLNQYLLAFSLPNSTVPNIHPGAAESCRRLDKYCAANKRWRRWTEQQKAIARVLVEYNAKDCIGLYRLARKVCWHTVKRAPHPTS